jgi:4-alpha-glucanotransferase
VCSSDLAGQSAGWTGWAAEFRDPNSRTVRAFAAQNGEAISFYRWLQWIADRQLAAAQQAARASGMRIGLYLDLAVGEAPDGSAGWGGQAMLRGLRIGAPPDLYQTNGQDWGLAALSPEALVAQDFAPFRAMIRAQLAHAGALRIDHAMALWQLFLIPDGMPARRGAYLRYPLRDMLRILAEESNAARALIVGEDLGSVPRGFRRAMREANILSYRVVYFEQDARGFIPAQRYPVSALACLSTHDLPTLADWWQGRDIEQRAQFGLVDPPTTEQHRAQRQAERENLLAALRVSGSLNDAPIDMQAVSLDLLCAAHHFIARTPTKLAAARLADLVGPQAATNVPGTTESAYPNWQLRSPTTLEDVNDNPTFRGVAALLAQARPRPA